jgi:hypothetical protein
MTWAIITLFFTFPTLSIIIIKKDVVFFIMSKFWRVLSHLFSWGRNLYRLRFKKRHCTPAFFKYDRLSSGFNNFSTIFYPHEKNWQIPDSL